ncbi:GNAT family N-acetyltransferase [Streptococcus intermedius]|uniref:GNAT family N-acetyltransferase n=1 Tax=Streptococcus intermedius TaxID=1338 RepID=UPI000F662D32|nr:GNAT family N-acetyltransferase [Streptococcus intermedius]RSJ27030.1 putative ribosomal N-acetyltransferase YdaF [Streptococcus intermedius]
MESIYLKLVENRVVETKRLLLRPVTLDDAEDMFEYSSDEENTHYTFLPNKDLEETKNIIARLFIGRPLGNWGIELKESGKLIGSIDLHKLDPVLKKAAIGYVVHKDYWNQGLATEALKAILQIAFESLAMNMLVALHDVENPASGRVMEKAGMKFSHIDSYAALDKHEEGRISQRIHYHLTKEDYFGR